MSIVLTPSQERVIEGAIHDGLVRSVDEFIAIAVKALPQPEGSFDEAAAQRAVARIRELRKGVTQPRRDVDPRDGTHRTQVLRSALVLDVSSCIPWCCEDERTPVSEEMLEWAGQGTKLHVPALWLWEVVNVVSMSVKRRRITAELANEFLAELSTFKFQVDPPPSVKDLPRLQQLAEQTRNDGLPRTGDTFSPASGDRRR